MRPPKKVGIARAKPGNSNALELCLFRPPDPCLPAAAGGRLRGRRGIHCPESHTCNILASTITQSLCRYRPEFERIRKRASGTKFSAAVSLRVVLCGRNLRHRYGTVASAPRYGKLCQITAVLSTTLPTTSKGGGVGRATVPTGKSPPDTILLTLLFPAFVNEGTKQAKRGASIPAKLDRMNLRLSEEKIAAEGGTTNIGIPTCKMIYYISIYQNDV